MEDRTQWQQWHVDDVMTRKVVTAAIDTSVGQLAYLLTTHRISAVPIVGDDGRVLGVVSEADLLPKVVAAGDEGDRRRVSRKAAAATAGQVMSTRPVTISADAELSAAARKMRDSKVKRLLVTGPAGLARSTVNRTHPFSAEPFPPK